MEDPAGFADEDERDAEVRLLLHARAGRWQNTTVLSGDPADAVPKLRDEVDGVILVAGSAHLVQGADRT